MNEDLPNQNQPVEPEWQAPVPPAASVPVRTRANV